MVYVAVVARLGAGLDVAMDDMSCSEVFDALGTSTRLLVGKLEAAELTTADETVDLVAMDEAEELGEAELDEDATDFEPAPQLRSYNGVVLNVVLTTPKLGLEVVGYASCNMYHQVLILPRTEHPT